MRPLSFATALLLASAAHASPGTFAARDLTVNERSGVAIANVCRVGGSGTSKVTIQTAGVTAKAGTDYVALSKSLTFTIPMCLPVAITTINDAVHEPTETFQIILSAVSNAAITRPRGTITILDDDPAPVPPPDPTPPPAWVVAPLTDDGYARCKTVGGCHSIAFPCPPILNTTDPVYCTYPNIIAQQGDVLLQAWNGLDQNNRIVAALWPVGHDPRVTKVADDWNHGVEAWQDEWEGVAPAP